LPRFLDQVADAHSRSGSSPGRRRDAVETEERSTGGEHAGALVVALFNSSRAADARRVRPATMMCRLQSWTGTPRAGHQEGGVDRPSGMERNSRRGQSLIVFRNRERQNGDDPGRRGCLFPMVARSSEPRVTRTSADVWRSRTPMREPHSSSGIVRSEFGLVGSKPASTCVAARKTAVRSRSRP